MDEEQIPAQRAQAFALVQQPTDAPTKFFVATKSFLLKLLDRPEVIDGTADTGWLDRANLHEDPELAVWADAALLYVAVDVCESEEALERDAFLRTAWGGRPNASHSLGRKIDSKTSVPT